MNNQIELVINEKVVVVKKLPLFKYAQLLKSFEELPKHLNLVQGKSQDEILKNMPALVANCFPDIVRVVNVATDMEEEEIKNMGLDDLVSIVDAVLQVNNYSSIYEKLKKVTARPVPAITEAQSAKA